MISFQVMRTGLIIFFLVSLAAAYDFQASIDRNQAAVGEEVTITIQFSGENLKEEPPFPEFDASPDFTLVNKNRQKSSSQNVTIINGRFNRTLVESHIFQFTFKPLKTGELTLPGCRFVYKDFNRAIAPTRVSVLKESPESRDIDLTLRFSKKELYLNEQLLLTALIRKKANSPIRNINRPDIEKELKKFFWIKPLTDKITGHVENAGDGQYEVYPIQFIAFPIMAGLLKVPSIPMEYTVIEQGRSRGRSPFDDPFFNGAFGSVFDQGNARQKTKYSDPVSLTVRDLPEAGKPSGFSGAVGSFTLSAALDKPGVKAGEAVNLKVTVTGTGNEKSVSSVDFRNLNQFEVFDPEIQSDVQVKNNRLFITKTFRYVLIPQAEGNTTVGPITVYFFNPEKGRYDSSQAVLPLKVEKGKAMKPTDARYLSKEDIRLLGSDIRFIKTDSRGLRNRSGRPYKSPLYWAAALLPVLIALSSLVFHRQSRRMASDTAYARQKKARKNALARLKEAVTLITAKPDRFYAALYRALTEYIADRLNVSAAGLTVMGISSMLREKGVAEEVCVDIVRLLESCDLHRFSSLPVEASDRRNDIDKAEKHIIHLEEKLT